MAAHKFTQSDLISDKILDLLDEGMTEKSEIFTKVVDELGVPRPTVRRVSRDLKEELLKKAKILAPNSEDIKRSKSLT